MPTLARRYDIPEMAGLQEHRLLEAESNIQAWYLASYAREHPDMPGIYSLAAAIIGVLLVGVILSTPNLVGIINAAGSTFVNAMKAAKPGG